MSRVALSVAFAASIAGCSPAPAADVPVVDASQADLVESRDGAPDTVAPDATDASNPPDAVDASSAVDASADPFAGIDRTPAATCTSGTWAIGITGRVVDESGAPVVGARMQFCVRAQGDSLLACIAPSPANESGVFAIVIPESLRCLTSGTMRVFLPRARFATSYCLADLATVHDSLVTVANPVVLFATHAASTLPPEGDPMTTRTVEFAESGVSIDLRPTDLFGGDYATLAARQLDPSTSACLLEHAPAMLDVFGISPESMVNAGGARVRVANRNGLAARSAVQFYTLGALDTRTPAGAMIPEGEWGLAGTGRVSDDGATIETDAGSELLYLAWFGYAPAH